MARLLKGILLIFPVLVLFASIIFAEDITITTYYPSPYGSYNELTTHSNTYLATTSGSVGIGTTNPYSLLDVHAPWSGLNGITLSIDTTFNAPFITWKTTDTTNNLYSIRLTGGSGIDGGLHIGTGDSPHGFTSLMTIDSTGVGIGVTAPPTAKLEVNGTLKAMMKNDVGGWVTQWSGGVPGTVCELGYDIAELFPASEEVGVGDIVVIDTNASGKICKSNSRGQGNIVGVVSGAPAILFEGASLQIAPKPGEFKKGVKPPVALVGRVFVNACLENGPIVVGDYIAVSSKPGVGMKANPQDPVVGIALDSLNGRDGEVGSLRILILINNKPYARYLEDELNVRQDQQQKEIENLKSEVEKLKAKSL